MSDYHIQVEFSTPEAVRFQDRPVFRIVGTILDAVNVPLEVFLHKKTLVNPDTGRQADEFVAICGPYDLAAYPAYEPDGVTDPPFFRLSTFDILVPGLDAGNEVITGVKEQLANLCSLLTKMDRLEVAETTWIPSEPDTDASTTTTTAAP